LRYYIVPAGRAQDASRLSLRFLLNFPAKNRLSYLPETIGLATGLRKLNLRGNVLQSVPDGICLLHALEVLDIAQNCLVREFVGRREHMIRLQNRRLARIVILVRLFAPDGANRFDEKGPCAQRLRAEEKR